MLESLSRRELFTLLGGVVVSTAAARGRHLDVAAAKLSPCSLHDVRLLDGPFLAAQKRDVDYLLSLQPDRMLHNFRVNAGLAPKAPVTGAGSRKSLGSTFVATATRSGTTSRLSH